MADFGPAEHRFRETSWSTLNGAFAVVGAGLLLTLFGFSSAGGAVALGLVVMLGGAIASSILWRSPRYRDRRGQVEVRRGVLRVDRTVVVQKASRTETERDGDVHYVKVFEGQVYPRIVVTTYSAEDAERLAGALNAEEPRTSFRVAGGSTTAGRIAMGVALAAAGAGGILGVMLGHVAWFFLTFIGLALLRTPGRATIGADGIVISYFGIETFIPFVDIVKVEREHGVALHRRDGSSVHLRVNLSAQELDRLLERIETAHAALLDTSATEHLLAQGNRSDEAWREALRELRNAGYRRASVERDRLWEVFENPGAEESARRGAAILLRVDASEEEQERMVRIGETVVSPELRDQLADDEEEARASKRSRFSS